MKAKLSFRKGSKQKKVILILIAIVAIAALTGAVIRLVLLRKDQEDQLDVEVGFPGMTADGMDHSSDEDADNMRIALNSKLYVDGLIAEGITVPFSERERTAQISETFRLEDQIEALSFYAETGDRKRYENLLNKVDQRFLSSSGLYADEKMDISVALNIRFCRVLLEGYEKFSENEYVKKVIDLSDKLFPMCEKYGTLPPEIKIVIPTEAPLPPLDATPTPKPTATPTPDPSFVPRTESVTDISRIDLYALKLLSEIDEKWKNIYDKSLETVLDSVIDGPGYFFLEGFYPEQSGYVSSISSYERAFSTEKQLKTALRLAEVDALDLRIFGYYKEKLINDRALYIYYDILTAQPITDTESITGYAYLARLARIFSDTGTYAKCTERIYWNSANSYTSKIFGLTFHERADGTIVTSAYDSISSLKALY